MQFWRLVDIEMINVTIGAQIHIVKRAAEAGSWPYVSVISLSKIDDASDISWRRKRLCTVKRHHKCHWDSFVAEIVGHLHSRISAKRMTNEDNWAFLFGLVIRCRSISDRLPVRMAVRCRMDAVFTELVGQSIHAGGKNIG